MVQWEPMSVSVVCETSRLRFAGAEAPEKKQEGAGGWSRQSAADMEATGLCFVLCESFSFSLVLATGSGRKPLSVCGLVMLVLLGSRVQDADADFSIVTQRLQYFQYEPVSFGCEGLDGSAQLTGVRNTEGFLTCGASSTWNGFTCSLETAYPADSGRYWCETETGERSSAVNISVTAGSVVLVSPVLPVMDGVDVTLRCRTKVSSSTAADFYKDGRLVGRSSTGEMSLRSVSRSDEGVYRCSISGAGQSPQSWLAVRADAVVLLCPVLPVMDGVNVTLLCRKNRISPNVTAAFYKDGVFLRSSSTGQTTVHRVSKSDEGFYTCSISGGGESAQSWLAVRAHHRDACSFSGFLVLRVVLTVVMVALLLGLIGFGLFRV